MMQTTIETIATPQPDEALDALPVSTLPFAENGHEPSSDAPDISPAPLLRGQQRPSPICPPISNHPLAPFIGSFNDEPLWDTLQEGIRKYRQRMYDSGGKARGYK